MQVQVNETFSVPSLMTNGVQQRSLLGPVLFNVFINHLPSAFQADCLIYADDLKLLMEVSSMEDADRLQSALHLLRDWSVKWQLPMNREKYSVLLVGASDPFGTYHIASSLLRNVNQERDLGVIISPDFKSNEDTKEKVAAAYRMFYSIRRAFSRLTPGLFRLLFTSHVRPLLEYGIPAAYPLRKFEFAMIEKLQRRGSKSVPELQDLSYSPTQTTEPLPWITVMAET